MPRDPRAPNPNPRPPIRSVDDVLRLILRSGLLDRAQLQESLRGLPAEQRTSPSAVVEHLVKLGKLSRFQAHKLAQGTYRGLLLGPFQVLAPIGRGGMGTVYLARDHRSGQLLALKVLAKSEERVLARFRREMEMSQRVSHPHIAWTFDVGVSHNVHYMAMEYIPGKSLQRLVAESGPLPVPRVARLMAEAAAALEHIHTQGMVHRDVKPANIMVTPHDHAKVLDLGLALVRGEKGGMREVIGGQGYVVGTMDYIAPEQTDDPTKIDGRADLYSLGCTLYYSLSARMPFPGGDNKEKMQRQREEKPKPLEELNPAVPAGFIAVINRLMAKDPAQRYQTAGEAEQVLRQWQTGEQVLPLDRPEDEAFVEAVAKLEAVEGSGEVDVLAGEETPGSEVVGKESGVARLLGPATDVRQPAVDSRHLRLALWTAAAGLVVGIALGVILTLLLKS